MKKTNIKMVVTDLDGTLLRNDKTISDYSLHIINQFRKRGNLFVIATARPVRAVKNFMVRCEFDAGIYHNGALICDKDSKIGGFGIKDPYVVSRKILSVFPDVCLAVESDDVLYANFDAERLWPGNGFVYSDSFTELKGKTADKIIVEISSFDDMERYKELLPDDLYIQMSENKIGMIMSKMATKLNGIKLLSELYRIDPDNIISFGDDYNDIDMLRGCAKGIAVENALEPVKDIASEICESNEDDGVAKWIKENLL